MAEPRWRKYELEVTPEMIEGVERYNAVTTTGNFIDDRGRFWSQERSDDYLPSLRTGLQIQWTYSKFCNFSCVQCFNGSSPTWRGTEADPFPVADRMIEAQPYNVCLCGGEPLTWKPFFPIIEKLRGGGIPLVSTVTNGYLCTPDKVKRMWDAGLTHLQFSLDGFTAEQFKELRLKEDGFEKLVAATKEAAKYDWPDLSVSFTPTKNNIKDWKNFCRYWADIGIKHIRTQPFMPIGRGKGALDLMPSDEDYQRFHMDTQDMLAELPHSFIDWGDPLEHMWYYTRTAATPWGLGVQTDGWYELSCYIPVLVADSLEHSIEEVWAKDYKRLWNAPIVRRFADTMIDMAGMAKLELSIYDEPSLHIDIFDDEQLEVFLTTDDLPTLRAISERNLKEGYRNH
jgi:MoaA/NifB/PqqE/SkfB family radical SAM enzyme